MLRADSRTVSAAFVPRCDAGYQGGSVGSIAERLRVRTFRRMSNDATPAPPGDSDPRHVFLTAKEVILRYGWGRTDGYRMLKSTGFPRRIGDRFRLDTLMLPPSVPTSGHAPRGG
jgi:hypothetical protein